MHLISIVVALNVEGSISAFGFLKGYVTRSLWVGAYSAVNSVSGNYKRLWPFE